MGSFYEPVRILVELLNSGDQIKKDEIGRVRSMYGGMTEERENVQGRGADGTNSGSLK